MPTLYLPCDSLARAVGADEVSTALITQAKELNLPLELQRTSSRGLYWLEPLLEVDSPQGRIGFGPLTATDVPSVLDALQGELGGWLASDKVKLAVNGAILADKLDLQAADGDEIALLPPVSGG